MWEHRLKASEERQEATEVQLATTRERLAAALEAQGEQSRLLAEAKHSQRASDQAVSMIRTESENQMQTMELEAALKHEKALRALDVERAEAQTAAAAARAELATARAEGALGFAGQARAASPVSSGIPPSPTLPRRAAGAVPWTALRHVPANSGATPDGGAGRAPHGGPRRLHVAMLSHTSCLLSSA